MDFIILDDIIFFLLLPHHFLLFDCQRIDHHQPDGEQITTNAKHEAEETEY
jgi:hypothetical protein